MLPQNVNTEWNKENINFPKPKKKEHRLQTMAILKTKNLILFSRVDTTDLTFQKNLIHTHYCQQAWGALSTCSQNLALDQWQEKRGADNQFGRNMPTCEPN